jgi:flavin-binding protein dodecin
MTMTERKIVREKASDLVLLLIEKGLSPLASAVTGALNIDVAMERHAMTHKTSEAVGASAESHIALIQAMNLARDTVVALSVAPIGVSNGEVHACGLTMTPSQACALAKRIIKAAYDAKVYTAQAEGLTRKALDPQPIVAIQ